MLSLSRPSKEIQITPPPTPPRMVRQSIDTRELEMNLRGLNVSTQMGKDLAGRDEQRRSVVEVGMGDINMGRDNIPGGWELIWVEDPWTGKWEKIKVPREEADYHRRRGLPQHPSYWGESEAREWRRRLREEREAVAREAEEHQA